MTEVVLTRSMRSPLKEGEGSFGVSRLLHLLLVASDRAECSESKRVFGFGRSAVFQSATKQPLRACNNRVILLIEGRERNEKKQILHDGDNRRGSPHGLFNKKGINWLFLW